jgi:hypothetical protein
LEGELREATAKNGELITQLETQQEEWQGTPFVSLILIAARKEKMDSEGVRYWYSFTRARLKGEVVR